MLLTDSDFLGAWRKAKLLFTGDRIGGTGTDKKQRKTRHKQGFCQREQACW
jgi:hypothetical protein